ncbi:type-2 ice-structuring protein-like [Channa argus]|uniref:type-2 ice-structuring protein-like n=1 Tax=Channa argus TaxID=215402 RepID=UPI0035219011
MKNLALCVLGCAVVVLVGAAAVEEEKAQNDQTERSNLDKRTVLTPRGWSQIIGRSFQFVPKPMTWAEAEKNCQSIGGNLASVHNTYEYHEIQRLITTATHEYKATWIGGSDAQQEGTWLWSNGRSLQYTNWCPRQPDNFRGTQHCIQINYGAQKCWDDVDCHIKRPSVCVKRRCLLLERSNLDKRTKYCQSIGANLASVHSAQEHKSLQKLISQATGYDKEAWIGGSDAQERGAWFWSDGSSFRYTYWCRGEPNNSYGRQHCLQMNQGASNCWGDFECYGYRASIYEKKRRPWLRG